MDTLNLEVETNNVFFRCVEDSTEAIMITNIDGNLVYVNPAWQRIYGFSKDEALGETPRLLRSRFQDDNFYQKMWQDIMNPVKGHWKGDLVNLSKDGREVPVTLTITPIRKDNLTVGYMGVAIDMTDRRAMESKIFQQDRLASIGLLASGLAHEIGTPLGVIRGRAELTRMQIRQDIHLHSGLETIIQQIDRITKLIQNLLNLSRDQKSGGRCDVGRVVDETIALLTQKFREYGVQIDREVPDSTWIGIDHNKLEQVLINLLMNSVHAIRSAYRDGRKDNHFIKIKLSQDNENAKLLVSDSGCGIPDKNVKNIFRPFFTTKEVGEGTGLGLSISYQILQEYGGELSLQESVVGQGTSFLIRVPVIKS